jgi:hypothetical protein
MNTLVSVAFGAVALTAASVGFSEPATARTNVGVYINPYGIGVAFNPNYCGDHWYRQNHWDYCARYDGYDSGYYAPYFNGFFYSNGYRYRHYDWDRNRHDNHGDRDDHRGGDRNDHRGGEYHHR